MVCRSSSLSPRNVCIWLASQSGVKRYAFRGSSSLYTAQSKSHWASRMLFGLPAGSVHFTTVLHSFPSCKKTKGMESGRTNFVLQCLLFSTLSRSSLSIVACMSPPASTKSTTLLDLGSQSASRSSVACETCKG
eukprot:2800243-Rhodomonas_salina.1